MFVCLFVCLFVWEAVTQQVVLSRGRCPATGLLATVSYFLSFSEWRTDLTPDLYLRRATHEIINKDCYEYVVGNGTRDIRIREIQDRGSLTHSRTYG
jgi:hypothetical protein